MNLRQALAVQSKVCIGLGSPFMGQLMRLAHERLDDTSAPGRLLLEWQGDAGHRGDAVPLRLAGALHGLVLTGTSPELAALYPPNTATDDQLWAGVNQTLHAHSGRILAAMQSPPQTNEIRRSAALVPAFHLIAAETGLPLMLSELGASAGLNLLNDQFHLQAQGAQYGPKSATVRLTPQWQGPAPAPQTLTIAARQGVDLRPFDLSDDAAQSRLLSYIWADQPNRLSNTRAALKLARSTPPDVVQGDAIDWLARRLSRQPGDQVHVVYHSIAWQYFPPATQARGEMLLRTAGIAATSKRPLAHLSMEADGRPNGAALRLRMWPSNMMRDIARVDFHGRWVNWNT